MGVIIKQESNKKYLIILVIGIIVLGIYGLKNVSYSNLPFIDFYKELINNPNDFFSSEINSILFIGSILLLFIGIIIMLRGLGVFEKKELKEYVEDKEGYNSGDVTKWYYK